MCICRIIFGRTTETMQCIAEMFVCVSKAIFVCLYLEDDNQKVASIHVQKLFEATIFIEDCKLTTLTHCAYE